MLRPPPRILVVDDDVDTCENLRDILTDCGYSVSVAHSGEEALPLLRQEAFDLALLDFKMPGMNGLMLYREIRKLRSGTVAVIISAYASRETAEQALEAGASRVLHKPVQFEQLLPLIESTTRQPLLLVVDDDRELCSNLWDILRERGYRVDVAHNEQEAAFQVSGRRHGIVLIDMKLPEGDGSSVFQLVRESNPAAHVILITGYRHDLADVVERIVVEGAEAVCYKPFEIPDLIGTIARLTANGTRPT